MVAVILNLIFSAHATTFVNRPLKDVVAESSNIVRGKAIESYSDWSRSENKAIYTYTKFEVLEVLKGNIRDNKIVLRQPGGSKDGTEMSVPGTANFEDNVEVVVLLGHFNVEDSSYDVPGFTTGKYDIVKQGGQTFLVNSLAGESFYDPNRDPSTLSYNSKIPLTLFRKIAKGTAREDEIKKLAEKQFAESKKTFAKPNPSLLPTPVVENVRPVAEEKHAQEDHENGNRFVLTTFAAFVALGAVLLFLILRNKL